MAVICYLLVVLIWATTPLAIKFSNEGVSPLLALNLRMTIALLLGFLFVLLFKRKQFFVKEYYPSYFLASIGLFPNMILVYYAANYISSGLVSVLFGLSPLLVGVFAHFMLNENFFTPRKIVAQLMAIVGLVVIFAKQIYASQTAALGVLLMCVSLFFHAYSLVAVKKRSASVVVPPFYLSIGALLIATPCLLLCYGLFELIPNGFNITQMTSKALFAIVYLAIVGSLLGVLCFYYVVNHLSVEWAAFLPMITPILALQLGASFAGELISLTTAIGAGLILVGLSIYQNAPQKIWRVGAAKWLRFKGLD